MSSSAYPKTVAGDDEPDDVEQLLQSVAAGRVPVQRVLEYVRDERDADMLKGEDYLRAINHVRRDRDVELVLARIDVDGAVAISVTEFGAIDYRKSNPEVDVVRTLQWDEAASMLHRGAWEILTPEAAKQRWNEAANGGDA